MSDDRKETYEEQQQPPKVAWQLLEDAYLRETATIMQQQQQPVLETGNGSNNRAVGSDAESNGGGNNNRAVGSDMMQQQQQPVLETGNGNGRSAESNGGGKETNEERQARAVPSRSLEDAYLNGFFTKEERQAGGIVEAIIPIPYAASSSAVQAQQHYEIREIDGGDEMEIDDDQKKEEKWRNPETFTFEKYMNDFSPIKPKPKPEDDEDIVAMIVESDPIKRAEALLNKAFHTVTFASPTNNPVYLQADRKTEITQEFWDKILSGKAMCALFPAYNWDGCIDEGEYHPHGIEGLPDNLLGGIRKYGLVPLQSSKKPLGRNAKMAVWMAPVCNLAWMAGHVGAHKSKPVLKSKNRVVAVVLFPGDPRLKLLTLFWIPFSPYCRAIHPARAFERILVDSSDTIEFDLDAIPYQFKHLPRHYDMVELMTPEERRVARKETHRKYYTANRDQIAEYYVEYYAENRDQILADRAKAAASLVAASFAEFKQKWVLREFMQCGCGEEYVRYAEYRKHIDQCQHRHATFILAKDITLETPGISKLYEMKEKRGLQKFNRLFGHLPITSPIRQSAHRLLFQELRQERLDQLEKELVLLNLTPISVQDLQSNFRICVIKNKIIEIQDELRKWHHYQH